MGLEKEFSGKTYDSFYGRAFRLDGRESYVSVNLENGGVSSREASNHSLAFILGEIIQDVQERKKVLLNTSPGYGESGLGKITFYYVTFTQDQINMLENIFNNIPGLGISLEDSPFEADNQPSL